jgi:hypothetical protein
MNFTTADSMGEAAASVVQLADQTVAKSANPQILKS